MIRNERGVSLVELILVLAIMGLIIGVLATAIYQIVDITSRGNSEMVVQHDLRNAAVWLNRDVLSASEAEVIGSRMVLTIPTFITTTINITYTYSEADGTLTRDSGDSTMMVARRVNSFAFSATGMVTSAITITITSRVGDVAQSVTLHLDMRPSK